MKVHSYTVVHYGADYIGYALQSVFPLVDQMHVIYTPHPSHGYQTNVFPIETKEDIWKAIPTPLWEKVQWYTMQGVYQEGGQRNAALDICRQAGADIVLVVDYDEVWSEDTLRCALEYAENSEAAVCRVNFTHIWRSFNWCCRDEGWPDRIINLRGGEGYDYVPKECGEIYHFGYAISDRVMRYKWRIHGHKGELREEWFREVWDKWNPEDTTSYVTGITSDEIDFSVHPTNRKNFWIPRFFDKEQLPSLMRQHPFWDLEQII